MALGEGPQQDQMGRVFQHWQQRIVLRLIQEIQEALVQDQPSPLRLAALPDPPQQRRLNRAPGGVVGLAEEKQIRMLSQRREQFLPRFEVPLRVERQKANVAAHRLQRPLIFGKRGHRQQRRLGPEGLTNAPDQLRRAIAADDPLRRDAVLPGQGLPQRCAGDVGIVLRLQDGGSGGLPHAPGQAQRAEIGRKIQRLSAVSVFVGGPGAAVFCIHISYLSKSSLISPNTRSPAALPA